MSTIIKFDIKELRKLANDKNSCVIDKKVTQNLALQPWCLGNLKDSVKNLLDYKIGKFDKEFGGILLSYKNLRMLQNVGAIRNDNADIHFQVQADYFIFQPHVGAILKGIVNKKSLTHLGILVHRVFNVVIPRPTEEPGNIWIGNSIEEGQEVVFRIVVLDLFGALPYIRGELDESSLKLGPEGEDEVGDSNSRLVKVSYINFDKTKPHVQKQNNEIEPLQNNEIEPLQNNEIQANSSDMTTTSSKFKTPSKKDKMYTTPRNQSTLEDNNKSSPGKNNKEKSDSSTKTKSGKHRQILEDIKQPSATKGLQKKRESS